MSKSPLTTIFKASVTKPRLDVSDKEKYANDMQWAKECALYFSEHPNGGFSFINNEHFQAKRKYYDWYYGDISDKDFIDFLDPLRDLGADLENDAWTEYFPAKVRAFNLIHNRINVIMGEHRVRPDSTTIEVYNPDVVNRKLEQHAQTILDLLKEVQADILTGEEPMDEKKFQERVDKADNEYKDKAAYAAEQLLTYLKKKGRVTSKLNEEGLFHYSIAGTVVTYKGIRHDEFVYEVVDPRVCSWDTSVKYFEDGEYFCRWYGKDGNGLTLTELIEKHGDEITKKEITLFNEHTYPDGMNMTLDAFWDHTENNFNYSGGISGCHVVWKAIKKIGVVTYVDPITGEEEKLEVTDDYKAKPGEKVDWVFVQEVWQAEKYTAGEDYIFFNVGPIPNQRYQMNYITKAKLPYNGRNLAVAGKKAVQTEPGKYDDTFSLVSMLLPYNIMYILIMFVLEMSLAKYRGSAVLLDKGSIPVQDGWDEAKFMYFMKTMGLMVIDRSNSDPTFNQYTEVPDRTLQDMSGLIQLLEFIEQKTEQAVGLTNERMGRDSAASTSGQTRMQLQRSALASEMFHSTYEEFKRTEYAGILDLSKHLYRDGLKSMYVGGGDFRTQILDLDPMDYANEDFGIQMDSTSRTFHELELMKQLVQPFAQKGDMDPSLILRIISADNTVQLANELKQWQERRDEMAKAEQENQAQMQQRQMQAQQQMQQEDIATQTQLMQAKHQLDMALEQLKIQGQKEIEIIKAEAKRDEIPTVDEAGALLEGRKQRIAEMEALTNTQLKKLELEIKAKEAATKAKVDIYKAEKDIEKEHVKGKYALKNKTNAEAAKSKS